MTETLKDRLFEAAITEAAAIDFEEEMAGFEKSVKSEPAHIFSEKFENNIAKMSKSLKGNVIRFTPTMRRFAAAAAACAACFAIGTLPPVSAYFANMFKTVFSTYDEVSFIGGGKVTDISKIRLNYLPDGYSLQKIEYFQNTGATIFCQNNQNDIIEAEFATAGSAGDELIDNERHTEREISISGEPAYFYEASDDTGNILLWYKNGLACNIFAKLPIEQMLKIAESVSFE
ncbi:hypothetical protein FACS1894120_5010 [Clostridia bacterium]|nr:hypothetical protein FACS1894120_5010 [Clostridia bacterium]